MMFSMRDAGTLRLCAVTDEQVAEMRGRCWGVIRIGVQGRAMGSSTVGQGAVSLVRAVEGTNSKIRRGSASKEVVAIARRG
jgi:hypothetical protein